MSEVKRISVFMHGPNKKVDMVEAAHLDRVTAERDAALADLASANSDKDAYAQNAIDLRKRVDALQQRLTAADDRVEVLERVEARYRWLQKATSYRIKKLQEVSVTDGGDVLYFHADRFDAAVDAAMKAEISGDFRR